MRYYKIVTNDKIAGYSKTMHDKSNCSEYTEITQNEYDTEMERMKAENEALAMAAEQEKDNRISELEKENAALLFQILTGEEYTDV